MKHLICSAFLAMTAATQVADSAVILGYPSVDDQGHPIMTYVEDTIGKSGVYKLTIGNDPKRPLYKFTFQGIETYGAGGGIPTDGKGYPIHFSATIKVVSGAARDVINTESIVYNDITIFNNVSVDNKITQKFDPAFVFEAEGTEPLVLEITFSSQIQGGKSSPVDPNGHFNIIGEFQRDPLKPIGSLKIPAGAYLLEGADPYPELQTTIVRE